MEDVKWQLTNDMNAQRQHCLWPRVFLADASLMSQRLGVCLPGTRILKTDLLVIVNQSPKRSNCTVRREGGVCTTGVRHRQDRWYFPSYARASCFISSQQLSNGVSPGNGSTIVLSKKNVSSLRIYFSRFHHPSLEENKGSVPSMRGPGSSLAWGQHH